MEKKYIFITLHHFELIKRLKNEKSPSELMKITTLGKSSIYKILKYLDENTNATFEDYKKKNGRKKNDSTQKENFLREIFSYDNSLTQIGAREVFKEKFGNTSISSIQRLVKSSGLSRKRIKRRSNTLNSENHKSLVIEYCARIIGFRNKTVLFLDESGFNLHVSNSYGYSPINVDAVSFLKPSKGKNISLCAIFSPSGILKYKLIEGAFNGTFFYEFLTEAYDSNVLNSDCVLIMDNVRFHHSPHIKTFFSNNNISYLFLPSYSPELNPIENVFGTLKSYISKRRPKATNKITLMQYITDSIFKFNNHESEFFRNFYSNMWGKVNNVFNGIFPN
ncbi:Transposable element Tc3 transposase [Dictyocoela muelleri]|nr:Transposable element Tc3 transposase [Dictyocoela muelleri]